jgi:polyhydroxyalkanoate synthase subunit PhaC
MSHFLELQTIMQAVTEKIIDIFKNIQQQPEKLSKWMEEWLDLSADLLDLTPVLLNNSHQIQQMQLAYWQDAIGLWQAQQTHWNEGRAAPASDRRFSADEWMNNPFFNLLSKQYLLAKEHINSLFEHLNYIDEHLAKRIRFFMRQYLDALSPDNFLHTNPQLMAETIQSHGKNLLLGLHNFLSDIDAGSSRLIISMTDKNAFKVGENIAITPGKVIYKNELMELIQYTPQTPKVKSVPLLIIPPWINKYYILDLSANNSLIRWLVEQGITIFIISWANPNASYANKGISDYLNEGPIAAIKVIQTQLRVKQVNTLGFCIGGTLLAMLLAYNKAREINTIRSATFLASMIDFSDPGDISVFIDEKQISKLEERMTAQGYLEGQFMAATFNSLRASDLIWAFFIRNYLHGKPPIPFDLLFWNSDTTNMPARMHSQYLRWMYLHNDLVKPGKIRINNTPLDISSIDISTFFVSTIKDHIAPWKTTYRGFQLVKGKKRFLLGGSGHIAGIIIPPGKEKYGYYVNNARPKNPEDWLRKAHHYDGSWWPEWLEWLNKESGRLINAPNFTQLPIQPIENAPGSYVFNLNHEPIKSS